MVNNGTNAYPFSKAVLALGLALWLNACATPPPGPAVPRMDKDSSAAAATTVFVISNGWHTGIIIDGRALRPGQIPETADFPESRFFEFGWGDAEFYPADKITAGMTLRAALVPTNAVVHVAGHAVSPERRYPNTDIVALPVNKAGLTALTLYISRSFARGDRARVESTGPGLYRNSRFYPAEGRFHLFNTCNTWTAKALIAAGFADVKRNTTQADSLMRQIRVLEK